MSIFEQNHKAAARSLVGKVIKVGAVEVTILSAEGYPMAENNRAPYTPVTTMKPGSVFCPRHRGGLLVLVACHDGGAPGGCVLIRKARVNGQLVNGPGRVAAALGIVKPDATGRITENKKGLRLAI